MTLTTDGQEAVLQENGSWIIDSIFDFTYEIDFQIDDGPVIPVSGSGSARILGTAPAGQNPPHEFLLEWTELNLAGEIDPQTPFLLRESPTLESPGVSFDTDLGGGQYQSSGYFFLFTELSLDGGQTWVAETTIPEPASLLLAVLAGSGLLCGRRGRR